MFATDTNGSTVNPQPTSRSPQLEEALTKARDLKTVIASILGKIHEQRNTERQDRPRNRRAPWSLSIVRDLEESVRRLAQVEATLDAAILLTPAE